VDFAFEDAVQSGSQLLLMATDGHAEIRDAAGRREREIDIGLTPLGYAVPIHDGWVAIGSLRAEVDGKEVGAAVQVHRGGTLGPTWKAPGLFRSAVARGDEVLVSDATGPVFSLKPDGALEPVQVPSMTPGRPVTLVSWGDKIAFCTDGVRRPGADPYSTCVSSGGTTVRDVWRSPPLACGDFLIADVQADATATSRWMRVVWSKKEGRTLTRVDLPRAPGRLSCVGALLLDTTPPGALHALPSLGVEASSVCAPGTGIIVAGGDDIWCLQR
jgi:hypothetical protein